VELRDYLAVLKKRWMTVAGITLMVLAAAAAVTLTTTPLYTATTRVFFAVQGSQSISELAQGSYFAEAQMASYAEVATSPLVLNPVREQLGLPEDAPIAVSASTPLNTVILEISATDADPDRAAAVANATAAELASSVSDLQPTSTDDSEPVKATILEPAESPSTPSSPKTKQNLALGLLVGLALGVGTAVLRETLDTKVRNETDLGQVAENSLVGSIPFDDAAPTHPVVMEDDPHGSRAEAVRRLRTNLQFVDLGTGARSIVVTSSVPNEGKTTTAVNLAVALADAGTRVLLVDADLRRPSVARVLGLEGAVGLTTVLIGRATAEDVIQPWGSSALDVLPAGQVPPNPSELLGSRTMAAFLEQMETRYDVVLLDSAPLLPVTDAAVLSRVARGTLVVVGADKIHKAQLRDALETLERVDAHVLGIVLNKVAPSELGGYGYGRYAYTYTAQPDDAARDSRTAAPTSRAKNATPRQTGRKSRNRTGSLPGPTAPPPTAPTSQNDSAASPTWVPLGEARK